MATLSLRHLAERLKDPDNYYTGLPESTLPRPRNILMFCRKHLKPLAKATTHQRYMLILNLETRIQVDLDGLPLWLNPDQALLLFPFQAHRYLISPKAPLFWIYVTFELPATDYFEELRNQPIAISPALKSLLAALLQEYAETHRTRNSADAVSALLSLMLINLLRTLRPTPLADSKPLIIPGPAHRIVQKACRLINLRIRKPLRISQLAQDLDISTGYLRVCFHRVIGVRVNAYIRRCRITVACSLLSRTEGTITDIAEYCGYGSVFAFSRAFSREVGDSPTVYRAYLWKHKNIAKAWHHPPPGKIVSDFKKHPLEKT